MSQSATITWLRNVAIFYIILGLITAAGAVPALAYPIQLFVDAVHWPIDGVAALSGRETRLAIGIAGGVFFGWSVLIYLLVTQLYNREPALARRMLLISIFSWFLVDSTASTLAGGPVNVLFNAVFLALIVVPIMLEKRT